jgi:transposase-like protein
MTEQLSDIHFSDMLNQIIAGGLACLPEAFTLLMNEAMKADRARHLQAQPHERSAERTGFANGFKPKTLLTRSGAMQLAVPQVRDCTEPFYPQALEKGQRSEKALSLAVAEMYLQGVSTRRVTKVLESLCGTGVSSATVSRVAAQLDPMLEEWRQRPIEPMAYVILDARYEKVRVAGAVRSCAVLIAIGVRENDGKRMVLGVSVSLSEAEVHWRAFLVGLRQRGLGLPQLVTSDAHEGLRAALRAAFPGVRWQRCQFHLQQNAQAYVPKADQKTAAADDIRRIFGSESLAQAEQRLAQAVEKHRAAAPKLAAWMEENLPEGFAVFALPEAVRRRLRTSNASENLNRQLRRRTAVAGLFPNEASLLRLVTALLMEISEDWETSKAYLAPQNSNLPKP